MNKNTILYGPPGTGKTFKTVDWALEILNESLVDKDRDELKELFAQYQKEGRIYFTTFHQNMAYEDFIEGIKPTKPEEDDEFLQYEVQDGLFMKACVEAAFNFIRSSADTETNVEKLLDFNNLFDSLMEEVANAGTITLATRSEGQVNVSITPRGNFSVTHMGRERSFTVSRERLSLLYDNYPNPDQIPNIRDAFRKIIGGCNATAFWSILNELAARRDNNRENLETENRNIDLSYNDKKAIVRNFWERKEFKLDESNNADPFVFIIDEINRGNVAQIFGELITLIEDDKRMGQKETIYVNLPYSKSAFAVPPNLYLIGTMNTADRSVEALDTALRRRFSFVPMMPDVSKLPNEIVDGVNIKMLLQAINKRLRILKDCDHTLGHAWLWNVNDLPSLKKVFKNKIIPLLNEYFYNDAHKLGLVLGESFMITNDVVDDETFAAFPDAAALKGQFNNLKTYKIKDDDGETVWTADDFISVYEAS